VEKWARYQLPAFRTVQREKRKMRTSIPLKGSIVLPKSSIRPDIPIQGLLDEICSSLRAMRARSVSSTGGLVSFLGGFEGISSPVMTIDRVSVKILEGEECIILFYEIHVAWLYILIFVPVIICWTIAPNSVWGHMGGARFFVPVIFLLIAFFTNLISTYISFPNVLESHLQHYLKNQART